MPKLILFDIDGTLIDSGGAGKAALVRTFEELTGIPNGFDGVHFPGNTDLAIIRAAFTNHGFDVKDGLLGKFLEKYPKNLEVAVSQCNGRPQPGVHELAGALQAVDGYHLGLLTGNVQDGARIKLEPHGLNGFFPFGAFGDDDEDRNKLLPHAIERLKSHSDVIIDHSDCLIIGDTPRDVTCAAVWKALCLAVATGPYSVKELQQAGADKAVEDLTAVEDILSWIELI